MKKVTPAKVGIYTVLTFWAVTTLYPFVWVILNSFRERGLIRKESFSIPLPGSGFTMDNYAKAMERFDFGNAYLNSLLVSVAVTIMVVLIDDEAIITQGLQKVVDWAAYRCRVAAVAQDAVTGAEVIRQHRPDILFTDIKMPGEDGLTMLAGLKGEFPRMQIAVLTGYRDFEYAQRAIRLGVARFLLKPSRMDELNEALAHMTGVLDRLPPEEAPPPPPEAEDPNSFLVRQAQAYIEEHCDQRLSLQDVAGHCYVSQWHLSKLLNRHLDRSFYDLLNAVRVRRAKQLMADPALRISEVAEQVGYTDTAHFSRVFKKLEGVSAGEWRNLHCGKDL